MKKEIFVKIVSYAVVIVLLSICLVNFIFAGQLCQDKQGIYYIEDGGMIAKSKWVALDLDKNGKKEYYFFNAQGFLLTNATTPDGYKVDAQGRWINNSVVVEEGDEAKVVLEGLSNAATAMNFANVVYDSEPKVYVVRENSGNIVKNIARQVARGVTQGLKKVANSINKAFKKADKDITNEFKKEYKKNYKEVGEAIDYANTVNEIENVNNMANAYSAGASEGYDAGASKGYDIGASDGYDVGVSEGYDAGASDAYNIMDQFEGNDTIQETEKKE